MKPPIFTVDNNEDLGVLFENWWESHVCPIAATRGWDAVRYAKWSAKDIRGVDFRMVAPDGTEYLIDLGMTARHKYDRSYKDTTALVTYNMVKALADDCSNMQKFLDNATLYWNGICAL